MCEWLATSSVDAVTIFTRSTWGKPLKCNFSRSFLTFRSDLFLIFHHQAFIKRIFWRWPQCKAGQSIRSFMQSRLVRALFSYSCGLSHSCPHIIAESLRMLSLCLTVCKSFFTSLNARETVLLCRIRCNDSLELVIEIPALKRSGIADPW